MPDAADEPEPDPQQPEPDAERPDESEQPGHRPLHYRWAPRAEPSSPFLPRDPLRRRWHNAALRIGSSDRVHAVRFDQGPSGRERVAPACHTGHDRADDSDDLHPVWGQPVSCQNCLSYPIAFEQGQPYDPTRNQYLLDLPGLPAPPSWPPTEPDDDASSNP